MVGGTWDGKLRAWGLIILLKMKLWDPDQVTSQNDHFMCSYFGGSGAGAWPGRAVLLRVALTGAT